MVPMTVLKAAQIMQLRECTSIVIPRRVFLIPGAARGLFTVAPMQANLGWTLGWTLLVVELFCRPSRRDLILRVKEGSAV